jgi:hypothetical protein
VTPGSAGSEAPGAGSNERSHFLGGYIMSRVVLRAQGIGGAHEAESDEVVKLHFGCCYESSWGELNCEKIESLEDRTAGCK